MVDIEVLLSKPYRIVDILPKQVPADAGGQYFTIEKFFLSPPRLDVILHKFLNVLLKLNCYDDILVFQVNNESWVKNPAPENLERMVLDRKPLFVVLKQSQTMLSITGEDHNMTVYGENGETLSLISTIASAEGLYLWKP
jgi:hypothetical protein